MGQRRQAQQEPGSILEKWRATLRQAAADNKRSRNICSRSAAVALCRDGSGAPKTGSAYNEYQREYQRRYRARKREAACDAWYDARTPADVLLNLR